MSDAESVRRRKRAVERVSDRPVTVRLKGLPLRASEAALLVFGPDPAGDVLARFVTERLSQEMSGE